MHLGQDKWHFSTVILSRAEPGDHLLWVPAQTHTIKLSLCGCNSMCPDELSHHFIQFVPCGLMLRVSHQLKHSTLLPSPFTWTQTLSQWCSSEGGASARHATCWTKEMQERHLTFCNAIFIWLSVLLLKIRPNFTLLYFSFPYWVGCKSGFTSEH